MPEILLILAIALIVLGPKKLPEIAKSLGRGIAEFKKATQDFKQSIDADNDFKEAKNTLREIKGDIQQTVQKSMVQGSASVDSDDEFGESDDAVSEKDLEDTFDEKVTEPYQEPVEGKSAQQAVRKEERKESSEDA